MLQEALRFARKNRYKIHPTKTCIVVLSNKNPDMDCEWFLGEITIQIPHTDSLKYSVSPTTYINFGSVITPWCITARGRASKKEAKFSHQCYEQ